MKKVIIVIFVVFVLAVNSFAGKGAFGTFIPSIGYSGAQVSMSNDKTKEEESYWKHGVDLSWVLLAPLDMGVMVPYVGFYFDVMSSASSSNKTDFSLGPTFGVGPFSFDVGYCNHSEFGSGFALRATFSLAVVHFYGRLKTFSDAQEQELGFMIKIPISWGLYIASDLKI